MGTLLERVQAAWQKGEPLALHREVELLAGEGHSRQELEEALEQLLRTVRSTGADDDAEEIINSVWDRLTGWSHASGQIVTAPNKEQTSAVPSLPVACLPPTRTVDR